MTLYIFREIDGTQSLLYYSGMMMRVVKCEGAKKDWEYLINEVYGGDNSGLPLEYGKHMYCLFV